MAKKVAKKVSKKAASKASASKKKATAKKSVTKKSTAKAAGKKTAAAGKKKTTAAADSKSSAASKKKPAAKASSKKKVSGTTAPATATTASKKTSSTSSKKTGTKSKTSVQAKKETSPPAAKKTAAKKSAAKKTASKKAVAKKGEATASDKDAATAAPKEKAAIQIEINPLEATEIKRYARDAKDGYMDENQKKHFREILAEWKLQLMVEVDRTVGHMKDDATNFPDPNDRATQEEEFSLELRTRDRERKLIKKINEAQKRLDDDEYGYCEQCGIEIGVERLEARPTAELCFDCKTLEEKRERQIA